MEILEFKNGELQKAAFVEIDGTEYLVTPAKRTGNTPLNDVALNNMQKNLLTYEYKLKFDDDTEKGAEITLPCKYKVGQDVLDVYLCTELLQKATSSDETGHYFEVGDKDTISNKIKLTDDWNIVKGWFFVLKVRGYYE